MEEIRFQYCQYCGKYHSLEWLCKALRECRAEIERLKEENEKPKKDLDTAIDADARESGEWGPINGLEDK